MLWNRVRYQLSDPFRLWVEILPWKQRLRQWNNCRGLWHGKYDLFIHVNPVDQPNRHLSHNPDYWRPALLRQEGRRERASYDKNTLLGLDRHDYLIGCIHFSPFRRRTRRARASSGKRWGLDRNSRNLKRHRDLGRSSQDHRWAHWPRV